MKKAKIEISSLKKVKNEFTKIHDHTRFKHFACIANYLQKKYNIHCS